MDSDPSRRGTATSRHLSGYDGRGHILQDQEDAFRHSYASCGDSRELRRDIYNFVMALNGAETAKEILRSLWDLDSSHLNHDFKLVSTTQAREVTLVIGGEDATFYQLRVRGLDEDFEIFVPDELAAVACLRTSFHSIRDIARYLLERGCAFRTHRTDSTVTVPSCDIPELGFRAPGYKPDLGDYAVYEARLRVLLKRRLTAVRKLGGLYWRIANHFSEEVPQSKVH